MAPTRHCHPRITACRRACPTDEGEGNDGTRTLALMKHLEAMALGSINIGEACWREEGARMPAALRPLRRRATTGRACSSRWGWGRRHWRVALEILIALGVEAQNTYSISWVSLVGAVLARGGPRRSMSIKEKRANSLIGAFRVFKFTMLCVLGCSMWFLSRKCTTTPT